MKLLSKYILLLFCAVMISSCDDLSSLNVDPDKSPSANPEEVISAAMAYVAYVQDGEYNRRSFVWAQYLTWGPGVAIGNIERYVSDGTDYNLAWARLYSNALTDLQFVARSESPQHAGPAKILQAYVYQGLVDHFGDVPFSQALSGEPADGQIFSPTYDDDQAIYDALIPLIDEGIADLYAAEANMGAEDLLYGGSLASWETFANSLKLRILMRQSNDLSAAKIDQVRALVSEGNLIGAGGPMAEFAFAGNTGDENPMYARMESGVGNFWIASNTSLDRLRANDDPRIDALYTPVGGSFVGILQGSIDEEPFTASVANYSQYTENCYRADAPVIFMSDWEVWFLRAEAAARFGTDDDEAAAFNAAVQANFDYLGVDAGTYIDDLAYNPGASLNERIRLIATEKWTAMNGLQEDEGWIESRRFDTPDNRIFSDPTNGVFKKPFISVFEAGKHPSIWLYPQTEISLNPSAPAQRTITEKVFWDN